MITLSLVRKKNPIHKANSTKCKIFNTALKIEKVRVVKGKSYLEAKNDVLHSEKSPENTQNRSNNQSSSGNLDIEML